MVFTPTLIRAEIGLCLFLHKVPDEADLTPQGCFGQVLTSGWLLWQDTRCSSCVLRDDSWTYARKTGLLQENPQQSISAQDTEK